MGVRQGLPYVYNIDEASNFVPTAVSYFFKDSYDPDYFINPPAFSYLLHAVFAFWFGGGWPFGAEDDVGSALATDPTAVFALARVDVGRAGDGRGRVRLPDRRAAVRPARGARRGGRHGRVVPPGLLLAPGAQRRAGAAGAERVRLRSAGVLVHGRAGDYALAGAGLGLAAATKYTAGICVLPLAVAAAASSS